MAERPGQRVLAAVSARSYQPSASEVGALTSYAEAKAARPQLPRVRFLEKGTHADGKKTVQLAVDHPVPEIGYQLIAHALGVPGPMLAGIIDSLASSTAGSEGYSESDLNFALSFVAGIQPADTLELTLATQMAMIHLALVRVTNKFAMASNTQMAEMNEKAMNRLARTFAAQVEALKRHRSKGEQRVYVERVNVEAGGQAVVGNVEAGGGR